MKAISRPLIIFFTGIFLIILVLKGFSNFITQGYSPDYCSFSIMESKQIGKFVRELHPDPPSFQIDGKIVKFKEVWLEEKTQLVYLLFMFKTIKKLGIYHLCFTLENPTVDFISEYEFRIQGAEYRFGGPKGGEVYSKEVDPSVLGQPIKVDVNKNGRRVTDKIKIAEIVFN